MGGTYNAVAELAGKYAEKLATKFGSKVAPEFGELVEKGVYRGVYNPARTFEAHPMAKQVYEDYTQIYKPKVSKYETELAKTQQSSGQAINLNANTKAASKRASDEVFGPKRVIIQNMLKRVERDKGKNLADVMSNHFNVLFEEPAQQEGTSRMSKFNADMRGGFGKKNLNPEKEIETPTSPYKSRNAAEDVIGKARSTLAFKAAPIHLANTLGNIATEGGLKNLAQTLYNVWGPSSQGNVARLMASDAVSQIYLDPIKEFQSFQSGRISKYAPGSVGEFIHRNMYIPGMSMVRRQNLIIGAESGRLLAQEAAEHLKAGNTKFGIPALKRLGIEPAKIIQQGYQLHPEDISQAYFHGSNNTAFLDPYDATPTFWRQSPTWRTVKAFSGYITKQVEFEKKVILKQYKQGDFVGIARNIALKSLAYPLVGATLYEFDRLLTGSDWDDPAKHLENRYDATPAGQLYHMATGTNDPASSAKTTLNTIDMIARLGVFGNTTGYIRGANRASLGERFLPPELNIGIQLFQDMDKAAHYDSNHPNAAKPLARDVLSDVPSLGLGSVLAHKIVPTRKEEQKDKLQKYHKTKQKPESDNLFNYTGNDNY